VCSQKDVIASLVSILTGSINGIMQASMPVVMMAQGDTVDLSDEPRVHHLLLRRRMAKKSHEFAKADALRDELRRECGVEVFDKTMIWKVIGSLGHVPLPNGQESGRPAQSAPLPSAAVDAKKLRKKERKAAKKAAAKVAEAPISSGFGHSMLLKMGWSEGSGLREGAIAMPLKPLPASERRLKQDGDDGDAGAEASSTSKAEIKAEMRSVGKRKAPCEATERNAPPLGTSASQGANSASADEPVPLKKQKLNGKAMARLRRRAEREAAEKRAHDGELIRRRLHNTIQELKGNIRVFCRVRPLNATEQVGALGI
jgi:hypothetical protein